VRDSTFWSSLVMISLPHLIVLRDEMERPPDTTLPDADVQRERLGDASEAFLSAVYPDGYDPDTPMPKKRAPASKKEPAAKRTKKEEGQPINQDTLDMGSYVKGKSVAKLTVAELREYLKSLEVGTSGLKKAELVQKVYDYFEN